MAPDSEDGVTLVPPVAEEPVTDSYGEHTLITRAGCNIFHCDC